MANSLDSVVVAKYNGESLRKKNTTQRKLVDVGMVLRSAKIEIIPPANIG